MRRRPIAAAAVTGALAVGATVGYLGGASANPAAASARNRTTAASMMAGPSSMMGENGVAGTTEMMAAEPAPMMRAPATQRLHQAMLRDPEIRRMHERMIGAFWQMGAMMRGQIGVGS